VQPYDIVWTPSGDTTLSISGAAAGTYNVSVSDVNGCIASVVLTITEPTALTAYAGSAYDLCDGDSAVLGSSPTAFGGVGPYNYSWFPSVGLNSDTASNPVAVISSTSNYDLTVTDANGCTTTSSINIVVHPLPAVPVISMSGDTLFCSPGDFYQWYESGIIINGADTGFYLPTHSADYTVVVTDSNGCSAESVVYSFVLGTENASVGNYIRISPIPAKDFFIVEVFPYAEYRIALFDVNGRCLIDKYLEGKAMLDIRTLDSGMYFTIIYIAEKQLFQKILITK
jgi:hypothetical protein